MARWAVFLDRDGVLNEESGLISRPEDLRLLPGAGEAVRRLKEAGAVVVVATNQPVVARGLTDEAGLGRIHARLKELLAVDGGILDEIFYCPHHPDIKDCDCRKPKIGMLQAAARRFDIDIPSSFMVGDSTRDVQAARNAGCAAILVRTGFGGRDGKYVVEPDAVCDDVASAAAWILSHRPR